MKIQYQAPKGKRIKKQFISLELDMDIDFDAWLDWRYYPESREWRKIIIGESMFKEGETHCSSSCPCRSLKAAIRLIKKWNFPKGTTFKLCSLWVGHDIYITV